MWYFYKDENRFSQSEIEGMTPSRTYTDAEHAALFDCDDFHYVGLAEGASVPSVLKLSDERCKAIARDKRRKECFSVIDRSPLWYNSLTDEQRAELQTWYAAWLDVTQTLVIPTKPSWLK